MAEWATEDVRKRYVQGQYAVGAPDAGWRFDAWLAAHDAEVRVTLREEAQWLRSAHANSLDKGYSQALRDGFASAIGWVELHAEMVERGEFVKGPRTEAQR